MTKAAVAGAGGMIGGALVKRLLEDGHEVRAFDIKEPEDWWQLHSGATSYRADLSEREACLRMVRGCDQVFNLAADMGGMGFIANHKFECMMSVLPSTLMLVAAQESGARRFFFASSACVYPSYRQDRADVIALREDDAYPADPEDGYGWEKLFTERMCRHFTEDAGLETRVARYHNVYGPHCSWTGGREKAPAAICRKVASAALTGDHRIEIWGDGGATRSFMYLDDCIEGTLRIMDSDYPGPLNLGSSELVTINELVTIVEDIAGVRLERSYDLSAPQGVRGRNSDNTLIRSTLGWEPTTALRDGLALTYEWVLDQVRAQLAA